MGTDSLQARLSGDLRPEERILWVGQPQGSLLTSADWFLIPFSLVWAGGVVSILGSALVSGKAAALLPGLLFLAVGVYLTVGRFVVKARGRRGTIYAVTDERVIVKQGSTVRYQQLAQLPSPEISESGGRGSIAFGPVDQRTLQALRTGLSFPGRRDPTSLLFIDIQDPGTVAKMVEDARRAPHARATSPYASVRGDF